MVTSSLTGHPVLNLKTICIFELAPQKSNLSLQLIEMSEYQDYQFSLQEIYEEFSMLESPRFDHKNPIKIEFFNDKEASKELSPTTDLQGSTETKSVIKTSSSSTQNSSLIKARKAKRTISIEEEQKAKRKSIFKGHKDDTTDLNTNFKTILSKKFKQLTLLREVEPQENELIQEFIKSVPSFANIKILCRSEKLKKKGLEFIKSPSLIFQILRSNVQMENKLKMLKYIECLKENFESKDIIKWKEIQFA